MRKFLILCTIICTFLGCASSNSGKLTGKAEAYHLISLPEHNSLVIIGVSGPQIKPEQEIEAAREDAARKVSMYQGLGASFISVQSTGTNALDYYTASDFQLDYNTQLDQFKDRLTFDPERDVTRGDNIVFVRFSYPGAFPVSVNYKSTKESDGSPGWIKHPPQEINGFMAQVGFAKRQQRLKDTIARSSENAISHFITRSSSSINTTETSFNEVTTSLITQKSSGRLLNFLILETWIDPNDMSVWTLSVAKNVN